MLHDIIGRLWAWGGGSLLMPSWVSSVIGTIYLVSDIGFGFYVCGKRE